MTHLKPVTTKRERVRTHEKAEAALRKAQEVAKQLRTGETKRKPRRARQDDTCQDDELDMRNGSVALTGLGRQLVDPVTPEQQLALAAEAKMQPLAYLIHLLQRPDVPMIAKIEAAKAAAPYVHRKMPTAVEVSAGDKPIQLTQDALKNLTKQEIATLRMLLWKTGLVRVPDAEELKQRVALGLPRPIDVVARDVSDDAENKNVETEQQEATSEQGCEAAAAEGDGPF